MKFQRHIPSLFTFINLFLGFLAILNVQQGNYSLSCYFILIAAFMDSMDGKLARTFGMSTDFGMEIDSLADMVSFCIAPSIMVYHLYTHGLPGILGEIIAAAPMIFGSIRLARFNIGQIESPKSIFIGLPTPVAALAISSLVLFTVQGETINSEYIIISTGAKPKYFKGMEPDGKQVITSKEAMNLTARPESLIVVGGGAIGVEFAHFYSTFGTEVTIIEGMSNILPIEDEEVSKELERLFKKRKIKVLTNTVVNNIAKLKTKCKVSTDNGDTIEAQKVIVAVGVVGNSENIGLEENGIKCKDSWVSVNGFMQTNISNIYAIGDVAGPPWLAHVASEEGIVAVEHICGIRKNEISYNNIPGCTYCQPEVASIGLTEKEAIDKGYNIKTGKFSFRALGKSLASSNIDGFVKIIFDEKYGELLGCHIIGSEATNLISEIGIARKLETTWNEILDTVHPHPTLSEAIVEATADAIGKAIHV